MNLAFKKDSKLELDINSKKVEKVQVKILSIFLLKNMTDNSFSWTQFFLIQSRLLQYLNSTEQLGVWPSSIAQWKSSIVLFTTIELLDNFVELRLAQLNLI